MISKVDMSARRVRPPLLVSERCRLDTRTVGVRTVPNPAGFVKHNSFVAVANYSLIILLCMNACLISLNLQHGCERGPGNSFCVHIIVYFLFRIMNSSVLDKVASVFSTAGFATEIRIAKTALMKMETCVVCSCTLYNAFLIESLVVAH